MPTNELAAFDEIMRQNQYDGELKVSHLVRIICRLCGINFLPAKQLVDAHRYTEDYRSMNWRDLRWAVTEQATKSAKFNWSVQNLDKNWVMLGYKSFDDAMADLRKRFDEK